MPAQFFQVLNSPRAKRMSSLDEHLAAFPYVNGKLFEEFLPIPAFNFRMREILLQCSGLNWGKISPAIFGSMFQSVMDPVERRNLGAHYTSEKNILKLIKPLFLDDLREEFDKLKGNKNKLREFHQRLGKLKFLDPACGCGNFLIITYRELRLLELDVMKELYGSQQVIGIQEVMAIDVDQFYGIEYDEFPARIAEVALWLMDHQMNLRISEEFGHYYARLPLNKSANIVHGNALRINWEDVVLKEELSYILGNPPFLGHHYQNVEQKKDMDMVFKGETGIKVLDYVSSWYIKAAQYMSLNPQIETSFVSTNSICQGEQASLLWNILMKKYGVKINFAHQTFKWGNEARGKAAVHVIIAGFALFSRTKKMVFEYQTIDSDPYYRLVKNISPYLVEGPDLVISNLRNPLCDVPRMIWGNKPTDGGNLLFENETSKNEFLENEPRAEKWIRPFISGRDFLNNHFRYCLWLKDIGPSELKGLPEVMKRVNLVKETRLNSPAKATQKKASTPTLFAQTAQPESNYLAIPEVSSENRVYIPIGFITPDIIASNTIQLIPGANSFVFGIMTSKMHMAWVKTVCGRMKSDFRYSNSIVYNNFPWPKNPSEKNKNRVEEKAHKVLDTRIKYPDNSLAELYDPLLMPPDLVKAHQELDRAVDLCYRPQAFPTEMARIEYLFELYEEYLAPLMGKKKGK